MKKSILLIFLSSAVIFSQQKLFGQTCGVRQLDPAIASFLKMIGYQDLTIEQIRSIPVQQIKMMGAPPPIPYPEADVKRIKITADSIPVLILIRFTQKIYRLLSITMEVVLSHLCYRVWNIRCGRKQKLLALLFLLLITG